MTSRWQARSDVPRGDDYDARWKAMAAQGVSVHGEVDCLMQFEPSTVLDAGCGTGRVAIELAARGVHVVGVDLDPGMLKSAREKAPQIEWIQADLLGLDLERQFDIVVAAGNVMIFLAAGTEESVVRDLAKHVARGGLLVAGFQLGPNRLSLAAYESACVGAGLTLEHQWSTWNGEPLDANPTYVVNAHRLVT